jgi:hypothetical protein
MVGNRPLGMDDTVASVSRNARASSVGPATNAPPSHHVEAEKRDGIGDEVRRCGNLQPGGVLLRPVSQVPVASYDQPADGAFHQEPVLST